MAKVIVQFEGGRYALRKGVFSYKYRDLQTRDRIFWWSKKSRWFTDCLANSVGDVESRVKQQKEKRRLLKKTKELL